MRFIWLFILVLEETYLLISNAHFLFKDYTYRVTLIWLLYFAVLQYLEFIFCTVDNVFENNQWCLVLIAHTNDISIWILNCPCIRYVSYVFCRLEWCDRVSDRVMCSVKCKPHSIKEYCITVCKMLLFSPAIGLLTIRGH